MSGRSKERVQGCSDRCRQSRHQYAGGEPSAPSAPSKPAKRHASPNQCEARFPQVDLSIAAGRAEVTTRAVVVITDKTSYTSPMPTHRQHPPPPPPPTGAMGEQGGTAAPGSPSSFSMVTGPEAPKTPGPEAPKTPGPEAPKTPDAGTAALETPAPSTPPKTTLNVSKKARVSEEPQESRRGRGVRKIRCQRI